MRRNHYDVTNSVRISHPGDVRKAVGKLLARIGATDLAPIDKAFETFTRLYAGRLPGWRDCETWYHDAQHSLDCALALARLIDGHERSVPAPQRLGERRARVGIVIALFHDAGYVRHVSDAARHGAEYTLFHVGRSGDFLARLLPQIGFAAEAELARQIVHFTGYERALDHIPVRAPKDRLLGFMLGTADLLAQLSDRCYLEKCRSFLYPEFELAGLAGAHRPGWPRPIYSSPEDLLRKTPEFNRRLHLERLDGYFGSVYRHFADHFGGHDPYRAAMEAHLARLRKLISSGRLHELDRRPKAINGPVLRKLLRLGEAPGVTLRRYRAPPHPSLRGGADPMFFADLS